MIVENKRATTHRGASSVLKGMLIGLGVAIPTALLLSLCSVFLLSSLTDPTRAATPIGVALLYLSAFIGGLVSAKHGGPISGVLFSGVILIILFAAKLAFHGTLLSPALLLHLCVPLAVMCGTFLMLKLKRTPKKRKFRSKSR